MKIIKLNFNTPIPDNFTGIVKRNNWNKEWYKKGKLHRLDGPAIEYPNGHKEWYKEGNKHRENGPAIECSNGTKYWYKEGSIHREDGPAIVYPNGINSWYLERIVYPPIILSELISTSFFLGKEKGQYNLEWLRFLTEEGIKEFPIIPGMKEYKDFKEGFENLKEIENK
jgi:hypothetical protein